MKTNAFTLSNIMWKPFLFILLVMISCKASWSKNDDAAFSIESISTELLGEECTVIDSLKYALVYTNPSYVGDTRKKIIVIDKATERIIYGPANINGQVSWYSQNEILVKVISGVIPDKNAKGGVPLEIINVLTGKKSVLLKKQK